jgi:hypothetical protein
MRPRQAERAECCAEFGRGQVINFRVRGHTAPDQGAPRRGFDAPGG